jgi:hypothetical protein
MKKSIYFVLVSLATAGIAAAVTPPMSVSISDESGKPAYKGVTDSNGVFSTATLKPANYVIQFNSTNSEVKGKTYFMVVSAGKRKVTADSVAGEKFTGAGVAMRIAVGGAQSITGQVTDSSMVKVDKNGKRMVWVPKKLGSNLPAHWASEDSAEAKEARTQASYSMKNLQDKQAAGVSP